MEGPNWILLTYNIYGHEATTQYQNLLGKKWISLLLPNSFQFDDKGLVLCIVKVPSYHKSSYV